MSGGARTLSASVAAGASRGRLWSFACVETSRRSRKRHEDQQGNDLMLSRLAGNAVRTASIPGLQGWAPNAPKLVVATVATVEVSRGSGNGHAATRSHPPRRTGPAATR